MAIYLTVKSFFLRISNKFFSSIASKTVAASEKSWLLGAVPDAMFCVLLLSQADVLKRQFMLRFKVKEIFLGQLVLL